MAIPYCENNMPLIHKNIIVNSNSISLIISGSTGDFITDKKATFIRDIHITCLLMIRDESDQGFKIFRKC